MERIFDEKDFYNLIDILEVLSGHPRSKKIMEYVLLVFTIIILGWL